MLDADHAAPSEGADVAPSPQPSIARCAQAPRIRTVGVVAEFEAARGGAGISQRQFARQTGVPRTTLQGWIARTHHAGLEPEVVAFFESPAGVRFLHRLFHALLTVMTLVSLSGLRHVAMVLRLSGLDRWIASSHGALHAASVRLESCVGNFGDAQRAVLGSTMRPRLIALCEDETHHPAPCLVAIEPASNFILVEQYAVGRDAATWDAAVLNATKGLRVRVEQVTSDLARGIRRHVREGLQAQHNADVFHVQYDASRATGAALAAQERQAAEALNEAERALQTARAGADAARTSPRGPGRPIAWDSRLATAAREVTDAREVLDEARTQRETMQQDVRRVATEYHPFDLETGEARSSRTVGAALRATFARMRERARAAGLSERREALLAKAARVIPRLVATIAWVHRQIEARVSELSLPPAVSTSVMSELIPGLYLLRAAGRARDAETREGLRTRGQALVSRARAGVLGSLPDAARRQVERVAQGCAELFVASSACVEGRNGHLRLHLHHLHRLPPRRLKALTVVHNFFLTRRDGTTAAERFFGAPHDDLFETICARLPTPPRPRPRRNHPPERWESAA